MKESVADTNDGMHSSIPATNADFNLFIDETTLLVVQINMQFYVSNIF